MRRAKSDTELDKMELTERHNSLGNSQWNMSNRRSILLSPYRFLNTLHLSDTELDKMELTERVTKMLQTEKRKRVTKASQTERRKRPFRYQDYRITEEAVKIELIVKGESIPFNRWNTATLEIAFKEEHLKEHSVNFTTISLGSSFSGLSKCDVNRKWVFRKDREVTLVLSLKYKNKKWQIIKEEQTRKIVKDPEIVTFDLEDTTDKAKFAISIKKTKPDVKYQACPCLCNDELNFVENRTEVVHKGLKQIDVNVKKEKVPKIAIIGSGGGMRAVIGMGAALDQLKQEQILDCTMYTAGLSGSAWYLLTLYAYDEKKLEPADVNRHIQAKLEYRTRIYFRMAFKVLTYIIKSITDNQANYFTFTNLFGELIGDLLLSNRSTQKWSDLAKKLEKGCNPLPLISALHVQDEKTMNAYNEWMEFSPYQVLLPKYGAAIEMKRFGDQFHRGFCTHKYEEQPIHFLHGMSGSAYAIVRDYRPQGNEWYFPGIVVDRNNITNSGIWSLFNKFDRAFIAKVPHFLYGITEQEKIFEKTDFEQFLENFKVSDIAENDDNIFRKSSSNDFEQFLESIKVSDIEENDDNITQLTSSSNDFDQLSEELKVSDIEENDLNSTQLTSFSYDFYQFFEDLKESEKQERDDNITLFTSFSNDLDQMLEELEVSNMLEKDDKITQFTGSSKGVQYNRWRKMKDFIWGLVKTFVRVVLNLTVLNFGYDVPFKADVEEYEKRMMLVDAGIAFNSPYPSVLHPARQVDIILSFDFSDRGEDAALPFEELKKAEKWARDKGIPFPELYPQLHMIEEKWIEGDQKEVYIFPGSDSPTIVHFVMINKSFRLETGSSNEQLEKFLKMFDIQDILYLWKDGMVITPAESHCIEACPTKDGQKTKLLEIMIKRRKIALKQLVMLYKCKSNNDLIGEVLNSIGMDKILDDLTKASVISADENYQIKQLLSRGIEKYNFDVFLDIVDKRKAAFKTIMKTLENNNYKLLARKLYDAFNEFESDEGFSEKFDEILGNLEMEEILCDLVRDSRISADMKRCIQEYPTSDSQKRALLKIIAKREEPDLKQLVKKLHEKSCDPNDFDILPDYGTFRFSYSKEEFEKFNSLVRHNVKKNMCAIVNCIKEKIAEKKATNEEETEKLPTTQMHTF